MKWNMGHVRRDAIPITKVTAIDMPIELLLSLVNPRKEHSPRKSTNRKFLVNIAVITSSNKFSVGRNVGILSSPRPHLLSHEFE